MSSKSRYNKSSKTPSTKVDHVDGGQADAPTLEDFEEYVHVPEGRSKTQFILLVALMIFLLIVFIIPTAFQGALTGGGGGGGSDLPAVTFETEGGEFAMSSNDFYSAKRTEDAFRRVAMPWIRATPSHEEVATSLLLDRLATEAGVRVSDKDLTDNLTSLAQSIGGLEAYKQYMRAQFPGGAAAFEEAVRRGMRIQRFLDLSSRVAVAPTADLIEAAWLDEHAEFAFDYLYVETLPWEADAKAEAPADEVLEDWLAGRPSWEVDQLKSQEAWSLGQATWSFDSPEPVALFERYPLPEGYDAAAQGKTFYTSNSYLVFKLDEERTDDEGNVIRYAPEEEVSEQSVSYAKVLASMGVWREDVAARRGAGETVDLALEAQELGLGWRMTEGPQDRVAITGDAEYGGGMLASQLALVEAGELFSSVNVTKAGLQVTQVDERVEPVLPPITEIRDEVLTRWARERANELAEEHLTALVGGAQSLEAAAFAALATGLGPALPKAITQILAWGTGFSAVLVTATVLAALRPGPALRALERLDHWLKERHGEEHWFARVVRRLAVGIVEAVEHLRQFKPSRVPAIILSQVVYFVCFIGLAVVLGDALGANPSPELWGVSTVYVAFLYVAPTPGGAGLAEGAATDFFGSLLAPAAAVMTVLLFRALTFYLYVAVGLVHVGWVGGLGAMMAEADAEAARRL